MGKQALGHPRDAFVIFTRLPVAGSTKTRLMTHLTPDECAELQFRLLEDLAHLTHGIDADIFLNHTPARTREGHAASRRVKAVLPTDAETFPQPDEGDLGDRLTYAFRALIERGYERVVLVGSDAFEVDVHTVRDAFSALGSHDVVLAPFPDGGYSLVGLRVFAPEMFALEVFSDGSVLERTLTAASRADYDVALLPPITDIDVYTDIEELLHSPAPVGSAHHGSARAYAEELVAAVRARSS